MHHDYGILQWRQAVTRLIKFKKALPDACSRLGIRPSKMATVASGAKNLGSLSFTATGIPVLTDEALEAGKSSNIHQPEKQKKILELEQKIQDLNLQLQATLSQRRTVKFTSLCTSTAIRNFANTKHEVGRTAKKY
jgi:hypothetical protein